ncbi:hypothetical protein AB4851_02005 [Burkholderia sp. 22PA0099]|uniref:hypothetical protein n=1 Tax=Burkholderia sp. 22PA0099 TaxID=3237372 RepID=UPI0039C34525
MLAAPASEKRLRIASVIFCCILRDISQPDRQDRAGCAAALVAGRGMRHDKRMSISTHWTDEDIRHGELSSRIVAVRRRDDAQRAALIVDVVDAFARLRGSLLRFVALFAEGAAAPAHAGHDARRFDMLLVALAVSAKRARFRRLTDLQHLIERVARAETFRDVIFAPPPAAGPAALREAALSLERLDAELVGLCVEHVLESRTRDSLAAARSPKEADDGHAAASPRRPSRRLAVERDACAEPDVSDVGIAGSLA